MIKEMTLDISEDGNSVAVILFQVDIANLDEPLDLITNKNVARYSH
jgi:hypothetical protein